MKPLAGSVLSGLIASACCGGALLFAAIGLAGFYASLAAYRYIPQVLALGALSIITINWWYYRRQARKALTCAGAVSVAAARRAMLLSGLLGLVAMTGSFVFLEWLNHAVVHPGRFVLHGRYVHAIIPGVPNEHLLYAAATLVSLPLLALLPLYGSAHDFRHESGRIV